MGQYYTPVTQPLISGDAMVWSIEPVDSREYQGLKLMEHSYFGLSITNVISKFLYKNPSRLWWVGDYAEKEELEELGVPSDRTVHGYSHRDAEDSFIGYYILNHTKRVGFKLELSLDGVSNVYPIALLTAVGNGRGGGDYFKGSNLNLVGSWAGDILSIDEKIPTNYKEIRPLIFREG